MDVSQMKLYVWSLVVDKMLTISNLQGMHIETTINYHPSLVRIAMVKRLKGTSTGKGVGEAENSGTVSAEI